MIRKMMGNELILDMAKEGDVNVDVNAINESFAENQDTAASSFATDHDLKDKPDSNLKNDASINLGSIHPAQSMLDQNSNKMDKIKR